MLGRISQVGATLTKPQLVRLLLRNKLLDGLRYHGGSSFDRISVRADGRGLGIYAGFGIFAFGVAYQSSYFKCTYWTQMETCERETTSLPGNKSEPGVSS